MTSETRRQQMNHLLETIQGATAGIAENAPESPYTAEAARSIAARQDTSFLANSPQGELQLLTQPNPSQAARRQIVRGALPSRERSTQALAQRGLDPRVATLSPRRPTVVPPAIGTPPAIRNVGHAESQGNAHRLAGASRRLERLDRRMTDSYQEDLSLTIALNSLEPSGEPADPQELDRLMLASFAGNRRETASRQRGPVPALRAVHGVHLGQVETRIEDISPINARVRGLVDRTIRSAERAQSRMRAARAAGLESPRGQLLARRALRSYEITQMRRERLEMMAPNLPREHHARMEAYLGSPNWTQFTRTFQRLERDI